MDGGEYVTGGNFVSRDVVGGSYISCSVDALLDDEVHYINFVLHHFSCLICNMQPLYVNNPVRLFPDSAHLRQVRDLLSLCVTPWRRIGWFHVRLCSSTRTLTLSFFLLFIIWEVNTARLQFSSSLFSYLLILVGPLLA